MLYACPEASVPIVAMTGISPSSEQSRHDRGVEHLHVTDETQAFAVRHCADQVRILSRQTDGEPPVDVHRGHDLAVHLADQDHPGYLERLGVGHPQAVPELRLPSRDVG